MLYQNCKQLIKRKRKSITLTTNLSFFQRFYHEIGYKQNGEPTNVLEYKQIDIDPDDSFNQHVSKYSKTRTDLMKGISNPETDNIVRVEFQYSPINPADINSIEGRYPSPFQIYSKSKSQSSNHDLSNHPMSSIVNTSPFFSDATIPGSEVIGTITHVSSTHKDDIENDFQVGDLVIPVYPGLGTWRSSVVLPSKYFMKMKPSNSTEIFDLRTLSTMNTNPCTAYRLLHDFLPSSFFQKKTQINNGHLDSSPNTLIIQNGGGSSVGMAVSQIAHHMGIQCISIVRKGSRSDSQFHDLVSHLTQVGKNTLVLEEERLIHGGKQEIKNILQQIQNIPGNQGMKPTLAFNCVGGESVNAMAQLLDRHSTIVTYGGMSKHPLRMTIPTGKLLFLQNQLTFCGYWHSLWLCEHARSQKRIEMMQKIVDMIYSKDLILPKTKIFPLRDYKEAFRWNVANFRNKDEQSSFMRKKVVFDCSL